MDDEKLKNLKETVDQGTSLKNKIEAMTVVIDACDSKLGFLDISINHNNQNEVRLARVLGSAETFAAFSSDIQTAAKAEKVRLEGIFLNLKTQGEI